MLVFYACGHGAYDEYDPPPGMLCYECRALAAATGERGDALRKGKALYDSLPADDRRLISGYLTWFFETSRG